MGRLDAEKAISRCLHQSQWELKVPPKAEGIEGCNLSQTWLVSRSTLYLGVMLVDKQGRIKNKNYFDFEAGWLRRDQNSGGTYSLTKTKTKTEEQLTSRVQFWTLEIGDTSLGFPALPAYFHHWNRFCFSPSPQCNLLRAEMESAIFISPVCGTGLDTRSCSASLRNLLLWGTVSNRGSFGISWKWLLKV